MRSSSIVALEVSLASLAFGCGSSHPPDAPDASFVGPSDAGEGAERNAEPSTVEGDVVRSEGTPPIVGKPQVVIRHNDGRWLRIEPKAGAVPENLSEALAKLSVGRDDIISVSSDAGWLVLSTTRFGCASGACLAIVRSDLSAPGQLVKPQGNEVSPTGRPVVAAGGALIVFGNRGPHALDLYATRLNNGEWTMPVLLTAASSHAYNHDPALSPDGTKVAFDCGPDPYGDSAGTEPCEATTDGSGVEVAFALSSIPNATARAYTQRPNYTSAGNLVFEGNPGDSEQIYRFVRGSPPALIKGTFPDDNSPCVLRDGKILSFWLGRPGNTASVHELKLMDADGTSPEMLITMEDLVDLGISCGG